MGFLLVDEATYLAIVEVLEDLADEGVLDQELPVLLEDEPLLVSTLRGLQVFLLYLPFHFVPQDTETSSLGT